MGAVKIILCYFMFQGFNSQAQEWLVPADKTSGTNQARLRSTADLINASLSSIYSINSLYNKENYRNKVTAFNNPSASEMGFSLENEINIALKPLLGKTKKINPQKIEGLISLMVNSPAKSSLPSSVFNAGNVFYSLMNLVGNLVLQEKNITAKDVDEFALQVSKFLLPYEKLKTANEQMDSKMGKFNLRFQELQFDTREFMLDIIILLNPLLDRALLRQKSLEDLYLQYLDAGVLEKSYNARSRSCPLPGGLPLPGDAIKTSKEIVYGIQKLFGEYQKIYAENYREIRAILIQAKELGKNVNIRQSDQAAGDLDSLYNESRKADECNLRLNTLAERLKILVATESSW